MVVAMVVVAKAAGPMSTPSLCEALEVVEAGAAEAAVQDDGEMLQRHSDVKSFLKLTV